MNEQKLKRLKNIKIPTSNIVVLKRFNSEHWFTYEESVAFLVRSELSNLKWDENHVYPAMAISGDDIGKPVTLKFEGDKMYAIINRGALPFKFQGAKGNIEFTSLFKDTSISASKTSTVADVYSLLDEKNKTVIADVIAKRTNEWQKEHARREAENKVNQLFDKIIEIVNE